MCHDIFRIGCVKLHGGETALISDGIMAGGICARRWIGAEEGEHGGGRVGG